MDTVQRYLRVIVIPSMERAAGLQLASSEDLQDLIEVLESRMPELAETIKLIDINTTATINLCREVHASATKVLANAKTADTLLREEEEFFRNRAAQLELPFNEEKTTDG